MVKKVREDNNATRRVINTYIKKQEGTRNTGGELVREEDREVDIRK